MEKRIKSISIHLTVSEKECEDIVRWLGEHSLTARRKSRDTISVEIESSHHLRDLADAIESICNEMNQRDRSVRL